MIGRIWHGWAKRENADAYERLLKEVVFPGIACKKVSGYGGIQLFRRPVDGGEEEFVTIMRFDSWEAVLRFSGQDRPRTDGAASSVPLHRVLADAKCCAFGLF